MLLYLVYFMAHRLPLRRRLWRSAAALVGGLLWLASATQAQPADLPRDYVLSAGDVVRVTVFQSPDLGLEARISESGVVGYPLLGQVKLLGLTPTQAEQRIATGLREGGFVKQPQVNLVVLTVRGNQVSVLGQVVRPGRYALDVSGMRLTEVLAQAGGVTGSGADAISITGQRNGKLYRVEIDMPTLLGRGKGEDPVIANGDVVYVDRAPTIYVYGEVQRPGQMRLERNMNVMQALAAAGGLNARGTLRGLRLHRRASDGSLQKSEPDIDDRLQDGDVVYIRESLF